MKKGTVNELKEYAFIIDYNGPFPVWLEGVFYAKDEKEATFLGWFMGLNEFEICKKVEEIE